MGLVRSLHFPRAVLPIEPGAAELFALIPMMAVLAVLVADLRRAGEARAGCSCRRRSLLMTMFNLGVAFIAARADDPRPRPRAADAVHQPGAVLRQRRVLLGRAQVGDGRSAGLLAACMQYNPVHVYIELVRDGLLTGRRDARLPPVDCGCMGAAWAVGLMRDRLPVLLAGEERYGRE